MVTLCKDDQIKNPLSKKCVSIKGVTGKKLIKQFIAGEIVLDEANVKKISPNAPVKSNSPISKKKSVKTLNAVKNPSVTKLISKSPVSVNFSKCENTKIFNPLTKKCVTISGVAGKKLVKAYKDNEITLDTANVNKLISMKLLADKKPIVKKSPAPPGEIPEHVKVKVHNFVEAWKKKKQESTTKDEYAKYCDSLKPEDIDKPIVNMSMTVEFPVASLNTLTFSPISLNYPKQKFTYTKIQGIQLAFNNYSLRNILYKGQPDNIKYIESLVDDEWLIKMNKYISDLPTRDIYTLIAYTHYGDVIANSYMRRKISKSSFSQDVASYDKWFTSFYPLFFQAVERIEKVKDIKSILKDDKDVTVDFTNNYLNINILTNGFTIATKNTHFMGKHLVSELFEKMISEKSLTMADKYVLFFTAGRYLSFSKFWQDVIRDYTHDLDSIIEKSPAITKKMIVYRGIKGDYYLKGNKNHIYKTDSFVSTSINLPSALRFAGSKCCFKRITLLPGSKAILLAGISKYKNEIELLLGSKSHFYITESRNEISRSTTDICNKNKSNNITVTDLVVVK